MRSNINTQQKSPSPPPPSTQTLRTIKLTKNLDESPPSPQQQQQQNDNHESLNKIIRTTPPNNPSQQQPQIQNITKKSVNINPTKQSTGFTITTVNNSNILNAINLASPTTLSTSYVASCSSGGGSSQINLPTTAPITKCSQALASATTSQNPSSSTTSCSSSATTLGPSTTAKLILTGSVSALPLINGNNSLIIETKPINKTTQKILVSTPRFTTPNTHQTLSSTPLALSTTPINIKSLNSSKLNDTLNKSSIIIDTKRNTNFVKTVSPQNQNSSSKQINEPANISHMQISQLLNQIPTQRLNNISSQQQQQQTTSSIKPNIIRKHKSSFDELSLKRELDHQNM